MINDILPGQWASCVHCKSTRLEGMIFHLCSKLSLRESQLQFRNMVMQWSLCVQRSGISFPRDINLLDGPNRTDATLSW